MKTLLTLAVLALSSVAWAATIQAAGVPVAAAQPALEALKTLDYPADWKIYVVGERLWADQMTKVDHTSQLAVTDLHQHITLIREKAFSDPNITGRYVTAHHVLAHELGHIVCNCTDEWKAENYANKH